MLLIIFLQLPLKQIVTDAIDTLPIFFCFIISIQPAFIYLFARGLVLPGMVALLIMHRARRKCRRINPLQERLSTTDWGELPSKNTQLPQSFEGVICMFFFSKYPNWIRFRCSQFNLLGMKIIWFPHFLILLPHPCTRVSRDFLPNKLHIIKP